MTPTQNVYESNLEYFWFDIKKIKLLNLKPKMSYTLKPQKPYTPKPQKPDT